MALSFTDDDLKRLKESIICSETKALLARLEAAEVMAEIYAGDWPRSGSVKAWRKAAGK